MKIVIKTVIKINPKKLLNSKWTATVPANKEKHFIVTKLITPELSDVPITMVELESVFSKRSFIVAWRDLTNANHWQQGWV